MSSLAYLATPSPPWVEVVVLGPGQTLDDLIRGLSGLAIRRIDGRKCGTKAGLLVELARALEFPAHFGQNWDALVDCLTDLEWLSAAGYLLVVSFADRVLPGHPDEYATLVSILESVGAEWAGPRTGAGARPPRPFHTLLTVTASRASGRADWCVPVRRA
jgi:RNAse (barnase) inhibitor barstar